MYFTVVYCVDMCVGTVYVCVYDVCTYMCAGVCTVYMHGVHMCVHRVCTYACVYSVYVLCVRVCMSCIYVCIYVCACVYVYMCACTIYICEPHVRIHVHVHTCAPCPCICTVCAFVHVLYMCVCRVCTRVCMRVYCVYVPCVYICACVHACAGLLGAPGASCAHWITVLWCHRLLPLRQHRLCPVPGFPAAWHTVGVYKSPCTSISDTASAQAPGHRIRDPELCLCAQ